MKIALIWPKGFNPKYTIPLSLGYLKSNLDDTQHVINLWQCLGYDENCVFF